MKFLRLRSVTELTGLSRSAIYALVHGGHFPPPVRIGRRAVGWREADIAAWAAERVHTL